MKAMEINKFGIENLKLTEQTKPKPGPGQVLVKFAAASINFRDVMVIKGQYGPTVEPPVVPCSDGAGVVEAVGMGVSGRIQVGDRVSPNFFPKWENGVATFDGRSQSGGGEIPGTLREYGVYHEDSVSKFADHLSDEEAACFPCAGVTAWRAVMTESKTRKGDIVLVIGTGGVALFALQFAKALGARVVVVSTRDEKLARAKKLGADYLINSRSTPDWGLEVAKLTEGGVHTIVETGGAGTLMESLNALTLGGHISTIGHFSGIEGKVNIGMIMFKNANIHGITVGSREDYEAMMRFVDEHQIKPIIDTNYVFEDAPAAFKALPEGDHFGKITITI